MDQIFAVLVWIVIASLFAYWLNGAKAPKWLTDRWSELFGPTKTLGDKLHKINSTLAPFAEASAHPKELAENADFKSAVALLADPSVPIDTVLEYAFGQSWPLSCVAFAALKERPDSSSVADKIPPRFDGFSVWQMTFAFRFLETVNPRPPAGAFLAGFRDWWEQNILLRHVLAEHFDTFDDDDPAALSPEVMALSTRTRTRIKDLLDLIYHPMAGRLAQKLLPDADEPYESFSSEPSTSSFLSSIGRFWSSDADSALLIEPEPWKETLGAAERLVTDGSLRVLLVAGEPYVGKTSFLKLLATRVGASGWRVFQASGADLQAGQMYIGQLEGRIRDALQELDAGRKIIWYVPDLLGLALSGTHQSQSASILDQMFPAISSGRVMIWTEASLAAATKLQQMKPALRRYLELARMDAMDDEETLEIARPLGERLAKTTRMTIGSGFAETAVDVAHSYLSAMQLPGSALMLMKMAAARCEKANAKRVSGQDVLETLSQFTGLPLSILDGNERLNIQDVQNFFADRVIGQPEAVSAIVERIAMLKSGLNDPGKPIGVFLFAGPTGTGKTELAKTVADYLFGSADRMIRLDMSEYQTYDSATKILGGGGLSPDADTLVGRIRKQPFSVILLDEFEKAHPQIWDLFLQVFDEGRLTDAAGQTSDFRHCLIILTSNLGATAHRDTGNIGFRPSSSGFTDEQVRKAISQTFRPEFQNRLDKVIVFRPLTRDLMRGILKKELARIFERRGLKDRAWAVEWDSSALEFLLQKGFSPEMGARPLKRAIDHYLIAPLAETIVERRFPEGEQFVFVRRDENALRADFVDPDFDGEEAALAAPALAPLGAPPSLNDMMRTPSGDGSEMAALAEAQKPIVARIESAEWESLKSALARDIGAPDFWSRPDRMDTLVRLELMDRIEVAAETVNSLQSRLARQSGTSGKSVRDLIARLAMQIRLVNEGLKDLDEKTPAEVALIVEPAFVSEADENDAAQSWCAEIRAMYRAWAQNRNMTIREIDKIPGVEQPALIVAGFGAHRALAREAGLHVLEKSDGAGSRLTAQVLIATPPLGNASKSEIRQSLALAFGSSAKRGATIIRRYRKGGTPLVRNADGSLRSGKVDEVLRGNFDLFEEA